MKSPFLIAAIIFAIGGVYDFFLLGRPGGVPHWIATIVFPRYWWIVSAIACVTSLVRGERPCWAAGVCLVVVIMMLLLYEGILALREAL